MNCFDMNISSFMFYVILIVVFVIDHRCYQCCLLVRPFLLSNFIAIVLCYVLRFNNMFVFKADVLLQKDLQMEVNTLHKVNVQVVTKMHGYLKIEEKTRKRE